MKQITETALTHILLTHPGAKVEQRDGKKVVCVPFYNVDTDEGGFIEKEVIPDPDETRMGILPVMNVRSGEKFSPQGDPKVGAMGQVYRIVGWTPSAKDSKD